MKDNISPEEKLLRLIRGQKKPQDALIDKKTTSEVSDLKPLSGIELKQSQRAKFSIYPLIKKYLSFLYIRKIIWFGFLVSCLYLIICLIYPWVGLRKIRLPQIEPGKIIESKKELKDQIKPYEFYLEGMRNRQIFSSKSSQETERSLSSVNADLVKDINLVGIISGENPQAIIEDKKTQKTYYVTKGQFVGEMQVEDIQEGKIILNYKGQRFELYL